MFHDIVVHVEGWEFFKSQNPQTPYVAKDFRGSKNWQRPDGINILYRQTVGNSPILKKLINCESLSQARKTFTTRKFGKTILNYENLADSWDFWQFESLHCKLSSSRRSSQRLPNLAFGSLRCKCSRTCVLLLFTWAWYKIPFLA